MSDREWKLGQTSRKYETGGRGPGTVSSGFDDPGGVYYGSYQMTSQVKTKDGNILRGGTVAAFLKQSRFGREFSGLTPGGARFSEKWKELARNDSPYFADAQHDYIKKTHYDVLIDRLRQKGLNLSDRSHAVQDALWSTAVQYGPGSEKKPGGSGIFVAALGKRFGKGFDLSKISDREIIETIQEYKADHVRQLFPRVEKQRTLDALENRANSEKADLLKLLEQERSIKRNSSQPHENTPLHRDPDHQCALQAASALPGYDPEQQRNIGTALYAQHLANNPSGSRIDATMLGEPLADGRQFLFARHSPWGEAGPHFTTGIELGEASRIPAQQSLAAAEALHPQPLVHQPHTQQREAQAVQMHQV